MKKTALFFAMALCSCSVLAATQSQQQLQRELQRLQQQTIKLQTQLINLQKELAKPKAAEKIEKKRITKVTKKPVVKHSKQQTTIKKHTTLRDIPGKIHTSNVSVHRLDAHPESADFYPTALIADEHVVTYIAGTPVVTSPYLGSRPAFDGSDYIVNISSINRDIRLMQQRRRLYRAYDAIGYPAPQVPILAFSGKVEPVATLGGLPFSGRSSGDLTLGSSELDLAAILNDKVEAYMALAYDESPPDVGGQRLANSSIDLNMGFVNIGDLDESPFYFTAGQIYVPFGRFSTAMVSAPLTMVMARTKSRPVIFGYKSQYDSGPFAALYGFRADATDGNATAGGLNVGYVYDDGDTTGEIGGSVISSIDDAGGMQFTGSVPGTTFGGFSSATNGNEDVKKIPAVGIHGYLNVDRYSLTAEWVGATSRFRTQDLSFNGRGAQPQAVQLEAGVTFRAFDKPSSFNIGYQWSKDTLALNLPQQRIAGVFNISIWKDTVESLEYRHDINFSTSQYANGAAPPGLTNANTIGPGGSTDTLLAQIGVFF
jgi:cell division protein FtsL